MKFSKFSHDMVAELMVHLAENESFVSIHKVKDVSRSDIKTLFYEIAEEVKKISDTLPVVNRSEIRKSDLSDSTHDVISHLSPQEENILLRSFKIAQ